MQIAKKLTAFATLQFITSITTGAELPLQYATLSCFEYNSATAYLRRLRNTAAVSQKSSIRSVCNTLRVKQYNNTLDNKRRRQTNRKHKNVLKSVESALHYSHHHTSNCGSELIARSIQTVGNVRQPVQPRGIK